MVWIEKIEQGDSPALPVSRMRDLPQDRLNNELGEIAKLIQLKIKMERPHLFSDDSEEVHTLQSPLSGRVIRLGYYRKLKSKYIRFRKYRRHAQATFDFFCRQRIIWLRKRGKRNLIKKLTDKELTERGLPPYYKNNQSTSLLPPG